VGRGYGGRGLVLADNYRALHFEHAQLIGVECFELRDQLAQLEVRTGPARRQQAEAAAQAQR
jgi:hypothetical protein